MIILIGIISNFLFIAKIENINYQMTNKSKFNLLRFFYCIISPIEEKLTSGELSHFSP